MTAAEVERVANGLTAAQRAAMRDGIFEGADGRPRLRANKRVRWNLCWKKLLHDYLGCPPLTPFGLAVRQFLMEHQP